MKRLAFLLLFILPFLAKAQTADSGKVIGIHPAVGKTITQSEKIKYSLFPEYKDSTFESAQIRKYNDSTFMLVVRSTNGMELKNYVNTQQLDDLYYRIENVENGRKANDESYVMLSEEEKKEERKRRAKAETSSFWYDFLAQMTILTFETIISIALQN